MVFAAKSIEEKIPIVTPPLKMRKDCGDNLGEAALLGGEVK